MAWNVIEVSGLGAGAIDTTPTVTTFRATPSASRDLVKTINIANTTGTAETVTVYIVPSGGSPGADNVLIPGVSIAANSMLQWRGEVVLEAGDSLQATASAAGLTLMAAGGVVTEA